VPAGAVRLHLIEACDGDELAEVWADLARLTVLPAQQRFVLTPQEVLDRTHADPTHRTFAICVDTETGQSVVGLGALHGDAATTEILPNHEPHVLLRGFAIDTRWQGRGIGTDAARQALVLAQECFPNVTLVVLTVHVDNIAGQRTYERIGFTYTDRLYAGRAGPEFVMEHRAD
jgi:RimJ/RimL family protein N-acetyltransferase